MSRREQRALFDESVRLSLAESDLDAFDDELGGVERRITARIDALDARLGKIMATCVAILTALVGSLVMLALNLATSR